MSDTRESVPHHPPAPVSGTRQLRNERALIDEAEAAVMSAVEQFHFPKAARFAVRLSLEEAIANAFRHGHRDLPPDTPVTLRYSVASDRVHLVVEDQGPGFDPASVPDPTLDENLDRPAGRGLMLIRAYMSRVDYLGRGNTLEMTYLRPPG